MLGPVALGANGGFAVELKRAIKLPANTSLNVDAGAASAVHVFVEGFTV